MENNRVLTINFLSFTFLIEKIFIAQSNLTYIYIIYVDQSTKSDQRTDLNAVRINLDRFSSFIEQDFRNKISVSFDPVWFDPHDRPAPIRLRAICQWQRNRFPSRKSGFDDNRTRAAVHIFPSFVSSLSPPLSKKLSSWWKFDLNGEPRYDSSLQDSFKALLSGMLLF